MAYQDTKTKKEADSKAKALNATHFFNFFAVGHNDSISYSCLFSRSYFTSDGMECGHFLVDLNSFTKLRRQNPAGFAKAIELI